jgi:hypothetical protein
VDTLLERLLANRPGLDDVLSRPHAEEALLADVVASLESAPDGLGRLGHALGVGRAIERVSLWGVDLATGQDDEVLSAAVSAVHPGAGPAVRREAEPDLLIVTPDAVATISVAVDRPGHAAARALRGEPIPSARLADLSSALGGALDAEEVAAVYPAARTIAVAMQVADGRPVDVVAVTAGPGPLAGGLGGAMGGGLGGGMGVGLGGTPAGVDRTAAWLTMAERVEEALEAVDIHTRVLRWRDLAAALGEDSPAYDVIREHPTAWR